MKELIYCQHDIPKEELRYGFRTSAATGCGWIATYNALRILGKRVDKRELIRYYERQLPLVHGNGDMSGEPTEKSLTRHSTNTSWISTRRKSASTQSSSKPTGWVAVPPTASV